MQNHQVFNIAELWDFQKGELSGLRSLGKLPGGRGIEAVPKEQMRFDRWKERKVKDPGLGNGYPVFFSHNYENARGLALKHLCCMHVVSQPYR